MKDKLTLPNIFFGIFVLIILSLGVRKYLQNQEKIAQWDADHAVKINDLKLQFESLEKNASNQER
jgi:hypothetical protein